MKTSILPFPPSRLATIDVGVLSNKKHHVTALLEVDVTNLRKKIWDSRKSGERTSLTAELLSITGKLLKEHPQMCGYLHNSQSVALFDEVSMSILVEKEIEGKKVPIPLIIKNISAISPTEICNTITTAQKNSLSKNDFLLHRKHTQIERLYYKLPSFIRPLIFSLFLRNYKRAYKTMGNAVFSSIGMVEKVNGWFIQSSIHPISFGLSSIVKNRGLLRILFRFVKFSI